MCNDDFDPILDSIEAGNRIDAERELERLREVEAQFQVNQNFTTLLVEERDKAVKLTRLLLGIAVEMADHIGLSDFHRVMNSRIWMARDLLGSEQVETIVEEALKRNGSSTKQSMCWVDHDF